MELKKYTVMLLYPDYATDGNTETFLDWVEAPAPSDAEELAKYHAVQKNPDTCDDEDDFLVLFVCEGWAKDVRTGE